MSDIKISQLTASSVLNNTDLLPISQDLGGGNWESKSITVLNVSKSLSSKVITVAKDGVSMARTIKDGVALALAMSPSSTNPIHVHVFPGFYSENNPIAIPPYVTICTEGDFYGAVVSAQNDGAIFTVSGSSVVSGFSIVGQAAYTNIACKSTTPTSSTINYCIIRNCKIGCWADGGSMDIFNVVGLSMTTAFDKYMYASNGCFLNCSSCGLIKIVNAPTYGYYCENSDSEIYMFSCNISGATNGIYLDNSGYIDCFSGHIVDCTNAIHFSSNGANHGRFVSTIIEDSISLDLFIESPSSTLSYVGAFNSSKFSIVNGATVSSQANDSNTQGGLSIGKTTSWDTMNIGTPGAITLQKDVNVNIGEGSAFTKDQYGNEIVEYWSYDLNQPSGSRFTRFANNAGTQLTDSGHAIVVGCKYPFPAIKLNVNVAVVLGSADIVTEYWDGSTWIPTTVACYERSQYLRRNNHIFRHVETEYVEMSHEVIDDGNWEDAIDVLDEIPKWDANESFYAIRFRNDGALTSGMQFSVGAVKPNSFVFASSGLQVNFGVYRTDRSLYIDSSALAKDPVNPPSYTSIQVSPNISYDNVPVFLKANAISQVSVAFSLPYDIDTSSPLHLAIDGTNIQAVSGDLLTTVYISRIDAMNPPTAFPLTDIEIGPEITTVAGVANGFITVLQDIDISGYNSEDLLFISFARLASDPADTYNGDFIVGDMTFKYKGKFV